MTLHSLIGRMLGWSVIFGNLVGGNSQVDITPKCADCSIMVTPGNDLGAVEIQLKDANGNNINYVEKVFVALFTSAAMTAFAATGGSTGLAIGTDGALLAIVAKKFFLATSEATGHIDFTWTDNATETVAIAVFLPNGRVVVSEAFANT